MDHIKPITEGGENVMENIQLVVSDANRAKGTMGQEAFVRLCADVVASRGA